jgi:hypothetical protein
MIFVSFFMVVVINMKISLHTPSLHDPLNPQRNKQIETLLRQLKFHFDNAQDVDIMFDDY